MRARNKAVKGGGACTRCYLIAGSTLVSRGKTGEHGALGCQWASKLGDKFACVLIIEVYCVVHLPRLSALWIISLSSSRLVTRIKESYSFANVMVENHGHVMKVIEWRACESVCTFGGILIYLKNLSTSRAVSTRKMMSYASLGRSLEKSRWRSILLLTCKLLSEGWYRGEILIESFSCWFPSKFPPG